MVTVCGLRSCEQASASRLKRATTVASATLWGCRILSATGRPVVSCLPSKTAPNPPSPILRSTRYRSFSVRPSRLSKETGRGATATGGGVSGRTATGPERPGLALPMGTPAAGLSTRTGCEMAESRARSSARSKFSERIGTGAPQTPQKRASGSATVLHWGHCLVAMGSLS